MGQHKNNEVDMPKVRGLQQTIPSRATTGGGSIQRFSLKIYNVHEKSASSSRFIHRGQCCFKIDYIDFMYWGTEKRKEINSMKIKRPCFALA